MSGTEKAPSRQVLAFDGSPTEVVGHVVFDLNGVLYDDSEWKRWLLGLVTRLGLHTHYTLFFRVWECEFQRDIWCGRREFWSAFKEFLLATGLSRAQIDEIVAATRAKRRMFSDKVRPFAGVPATLNRLNSGGTDLVIASRSPQSVGEMNEKLCRLGLTVHSKKVVATRDPRLVEDADLFFHWLTGKRDCRPGTTAYVGRDREDLGAAARAGMLTIAFNHAADAEAHLYIDQFDQLIQVVGGSRRLLAAG